MAAESFNIQSFRSLEAIQKTQWGQLSPPDFPFADYDYLRALETSHSVGEASGWSPLYLTASIDGSIQGASTLYSKAHSYGEYIFDWAWAQAYERHQIPYYPKLLGAIPFTPATGPKFLFAPHANREKVAATLIAASLQQMETLSQSSLHYLFITPEEVSYLERTGFLIRHSFQYHWENRGYSTFGDFLDALKSRKRKQVVREREQLQQESLVFHAVTGNDLTPAHAKLFYGFYLSTLSKMGAYAYLTETFFSEVFDSMRNQIVLFLAGKEGEAVAGSLCYFKGNTLYGRYWGATQEVRNLHFELCYYRPIEWAIARGLKRFEAGAQGEHKVARGFLPATTYSAHWIRHPQFREAIGRFIEEEKSSIQRLFEEMKAHSPFR